MRIRPTAIGASATTPPNGSYDAGERLRARPGITGRGSAALTFCALSLALVMVVTALVPTGGYAGANRTASLTPLGVAPPGAPSLQLLPANGTLGSTIAASGSGFAGNATVTFSFGGSAINSNCGSDLAGAFPGSTGLPCNFTVPSTAPGGPSPIVASAWNLSYSLGVGSGPNGVAYDAGTNQLFVANYYSNNVSVIDASNNTVAATILTGCGPQAVAYDSGLSEIFVTLACADTVAVISDTNDSVLANVPVGTKPVSIAYDPTSGSLFVVNSNSDNVSVIDDANNSVIATVGLGSFTDPVSAVYDPDVGEVFVANYWGDNISVIGGTNDSLAGSFNSNSDPYALAYDPAQRDLYVADYNYYGSIAVVSVANETIFTSIYAGDYPEAIGYDPTTAQVFVGNANYFAPRWFDSVSVISTSTNALVANLSGGGFPEGFAYDPGAQTMYVSELSNNTLGWIRPEGNASGTFTVLASVLLYPTSGGVGDEVGTSGVGFAANASLSFSVAGTAVASNCTTNAEGAFQSTRRLCTFTVPPTPAGTAMIVATNGTTTAQANFTVLSSFALAESGGAVGSTVNASGTGFAASAAISFTFGGVAVLSSCSTDAHGSFPGASGTPCTFLVPPTPMGSATVTATDGTNLQEASYVVTSGLGLSVNAGIVGSSLTVSGIGFVPSSPVTFAIDNVSAPTTCSTDSSGNFPGLSGTPCTLTVPAVAGGPQLVSATVGAGIETAFYSVEESFTLSQEHGLVGAEVTASGTGGPASAAILFTFDGAPIASNCSSDASGSFPGSTGTPCTLAVPAGTAGGHALLALASPTAAGSEIPVGQYPTGLAYDPITGQMFVADDNENDVSIIDDSNGSVVANPVTGCGPYGVAYDPLDEEMFVVDNCVDKVAVIAAGNDTVVGSTPLPSGSSATNIAYDSGTNQLFVVDSQLDLVSVIDASNDTVVANVSVGDYPIGIAYDPHMGEVFVTDARDDNVTVIADSNDTIVATVPVGCNPQAVVFDNVSDELFVANACDRDVSVIADSNDTVLTTIGVGSHPEAEVFDPMTGLLFVGNQYDDTVTAICAANDTVVGTINVGSDPVALAVDPTTSALYVAEDNDNDVSVVSESMAQANFTIAASLILPDGIEGADTGEHLLVEGNGFGSLLPISSFTLGGEPVTCVAAIEGTCVGGSLTTNVNGTFEAVILVPSSLSAGAYSLNATDSDGNNASTLVAVDPAVTVGAIHAAPTSIDAGQNLLLTVVAHNGSGGYRYEWSGLPTGCTPTAATVDCTVGAPGNYSITVTVIDSNGGSNVSAPLGLRVYADPTVARPEASLPSGSVDANQSVNFTAIADQGTGTYVAFSWSGLPVGCTGTGSRVSCSGADLPPGSYSISATVTDSNGWTSDRSSALAFIVEPDPTVLAPTSNRTSADVGQRVSISDGSVLGPMIRAFGWSGLPSGCTGTGSSDVTCALGTAGTYSVSVFVTDVNNFTALSPAVTLVVYSDPSVQVSASRPAFDVGSIVTVLAATQNGSGGFTFRWSGLPTGCAGTTVSINCTPTNAGNYSIAVVATDGNGESANSQPLALRVGAAVTASVTSSLASVAVGQSVGFAATGEGGIGALAYHWVFGDGTTGSSASVTHAYSTPGSYSVTVWVNDTVGGSAVKTLTISVTPPASSTSSSSSGLGIATEAAIVVVVVAAAAVLGLLLIRRRRPPVPAKTPDTPSSSSNASVETTKSEGSTPIGEEE
jgi:YVTN family beta-propeller protein